MSKKNATLKLLSMLPFFKGYQSPDFHDYKNMDDRILAQLRNKRKGKFKRKNSHK